MQFILNIYFDETYTLPLAEIISDEFEFTKNRKCYQTPVLKSNQIQTKSLAILVSTIV